VARRRRSADTVWAGLSQGATVLVDTAPIIYVLEDHPTLAPRFAGLFVAEAEGAVHILISTITLAEVLAGPYRQGQDALAQRFERALRRYAMLPVTPEIAAAAARLRARYSLKLPDALQLATALESGAQALVTHDRDFSDVRGIDILTGTSA